MKITKKDKRTNLEKEIDSVLVEMSAWLPYSPEYKAAVDNLEKLYKAKNEEYNRRIKPDTIMNGVVNLTGILLVLNFEKINIITSRAFNLIVKGRV